MVIFRENTEDIYAGIEYAAGTPEAQKVLDFIAREFPKDFKKIRFGTADKVIEFLMPPGFQSRPTNDDHTGRHWYQSCQHGRLHAPHRIRHQICH